MTSSPFPAHDYPDDVRVVELKGRVILLIGTAHISRQSVDLVREVIDQERPDRVCIELDDKRFQALSKVEWWRGLNLKEIIRNKQLSLLLVNLALSSYQKRLGGKLGVMPGSELMAAARSAEKYGIPISLCDRDVRATLRRSWHAVPLWRKGRLFIALLASLFDDTELSEEKLAELRRGDVLSELMRELGDSMPELKRVLIDERDVFLAEKIKAAPGERIVAVVGAGHVPGIVTALERDNGADLAELESLPTASKGWRIAGWSIPVCIVGSLVAIGMRKGAAAVGSSLLYWTLAHSLPSALGAAMARGHILTVAAAFVGAPFTSLSPLIGAGYVCAFVQVMTRPPLVAEFETVGQDMSSLWGWWRNRLLRVFLVFLLSGFGSTIGTYVGGYEILKNLLQ